MWDSAITGEREHHSGVGRHTEEAAVPHTYDDQSEEHDCAVVSEAVDEDLKDRVAVVRGDGGVEVLDRE